ncbi:hypothetical protein [Streptomyces sp. SID11385]|uniref:hypothetical protein n=1 Tax=Streptomyces sp. SID11385 TaxID=2706031 RepID=UPI0031BA3025
MGTVPNDELRPGEERRSGPRHAAPRKSVLTKFRIPAGKAMALAAMPTAVFVGMGLTPRLALADDKTDLPFAPGPCVTRSDEPGQEPSGSASASTKPEPSTSTSPGASPSPSATPNPSASDEAKDGAKDGAEDAAKDGAEAKAEDGSGTTAAGQDEADASPGAKTAKKAQDEPSSSPSPSASETKNPLDPLGLGDALKDLFTPKDKKDQKDEDADASGEEKSTADDKAADTKDTKDADAKADDESADGKTADDKTADAKADDDAGDAKAGDDAGPRTLKDDLSAAARAAGASEEDIAEGARKAGEQNAKGPQGAKADGTKAAKGDEPEPYPCPTHDAKALADADVDESFPRVAEDPWTLHTTKLSLHGLGYDGIVKVRTPSGKVKNVLKFTATGIDIKDLHQTAVGPGEYTTHVKGAPGSTSTIRDGKVTMYTEELKGKLLGLIPVDFTPDSPPPLTLPELFFTDATVVQAGQFGGTLTIPGLHNYLDTSGS